MALIFANAILKWSRVLSTHRIRRLLSSSRYGLFLQDGTLFQSLAYPHALRSLLQHPVWYQAEIVLINNTFSRRWLTTLGQTNEDHCHPDFLTYVRSALENLEGSSYQWLNLKNDKRESWGKGGVFLVAVNLFFKNDMLPVHESSIVIDSLKYVQQRIPKLHIFGVQNASSCSSSYDIREVEMAVLKNFITFPILLSSKCFSKTLDGSIYLFSNCNGQLALNRVDSTPDKIIGDVKHYLDLRDSEFLSELSSCSSNEGLGLPEKQVQPLKDPVVCHLWRDFLLFFPGSVSTDTNGRYIFVADTLHHRIIVADANGMVLDCIGSSPGFEDGPFHDAMLCCPASCIFNNDENCLYFADSENHAIRKADMTKKWVETIYPRFSIDEENGLWKFWKRLMQKLHLKTLNDDNSADNQFGDLMFPWHVAVSDNNEFVISNRRFGTLWILDTSKGEIKEIIEGAHSSELFWQRACIERQQILDALEVLRSKPEYLVSTLDNLSPSYFISRLAIAGDNCVFVDTDGQKILRLNINTADVSYISFSNLGILGLPYWWSSDVGMLCQSRNVTGVKEINQKSSFYSFNVQPGRCEIRIKFILPRGTRLAASVDKGSIWRQSRGSVVELSMYDGMLMVDKIGVAQQFYDELEEVICDEISKENVELESKEESEDFTAYISSCVDVSRGVGELVLDAVLYLTLDESTSAQEGQSIFSIVGSDQLRIQPLPSTMAFIENQKNLVFMKQTHARIRFKCSDDAPTEKIFYLNIEI